MELVYVGKVISTHGIKGELKIKSDFAYLNDAFRIGNYLIIDNKKYKIKTYRRHKDYEMVTLDDFKNINEVLFLLKEKVYVDRDSLDETLILDSDLLNYKVIINGEIGVVKEVFFASKTNKVLRILLDEHEILVPYVKEFVKKIDSKNKEIYIEVIDGMML